jgi:hypothetical protein
VLAHAHAGWLTGAERVHVVGIMAFDLSAAFDTRSYLPRHGREQEHPGGNGRKSADSVVRSNHF